MQIYKQTINRCICKAEDILIFIIHTSVYLDKYHNLI